MNPYLNPRPAHSHSQESIKGNRVTPYALLDTDAPLNPPSSSTANQNQNVYVVHADGGGEDLHIQLPTPGARVIEMPPQYRGGDGPTGSSGSTPGTPGGGGGGGKRPKMGLSLSSGSQPEGVNPPVSPVMSQVTSEKSRQ